MRLLAKVVTIFDRITDLLAFFAIAIIIFIMLSVTYDVVMRYFGHPTLWVVEISEYSLLYMTFLVAAWLLKREGHVKIDLVLNRLSPRAQAMTNVITSIFGLIICLVITWYTAKVTWSHFERGLYMPTYLEVPNAYILVVIPVGSFMLFIQFLRRIHTYLRSFKESA